MREKTRKSLSTLLESLKSTAFDHFLIKLDEGEGESSTRGMKKHSSLALVVMVLGLAGCMGSFTLTKKLYGFNDTVTDSKVINNVIFWGLNILPIYEFAVLGDALILNTIEFWTGSNLLADAGAGADDRVAVVENDDGSLSVARGDVLFTLMADGKDRVRVVVDGKDVGFAERRADGSIIAFDNDHVERAVVSAEDAAVVGSVVAANVP